MTWLDTTILTASSAVLFFFVVVLFPQFVGRLRQIARSVAAVPRRGASRERGTSHRFQVGMP
jgi:hypothetical protein